MNADRYTGSVTPSFSSAPPALTRLPKHIRHSLPLLATAVWLGLIGWLIWRHVRLNEQPLIADAAEYWLKARNFWERMSAGSSFNPFNVYPTARPPGTVLMSYPFGFSESTTGFLFRSVFFPIVLTAAAIHVAGRAAGSSYERRIDIACIAAFVCAAPLFFHFEYIGTGPTFWGLVDCFIGGAAAVTAAFALYAAKRSSTAAAFGAATFAIICFATKPSGVFVAALTGMAWIVIGVGLRLGEGGSPGPRARLGLPSLLAGLLIYSVCVGSVVIVGRFFSDYFSATNIAFGNRVLGSLREEWLVPNLVDLMRKLDTTIGLPLLITTIVVLVFGLWQFRTTSPRLAPVERRLVPLATCGALIFLLGGVWFWLIYTGGSQIRYFYPFALPTVVFLLPAALSLIGRAPSTARLIVRALLLLPLINITLLLAITSPSPVWQRISGVNIAVHDAHEDLIFADQLLRSVRGSGRNAVVYEEMSGDAGVVQSAWGFEGLANPTKPNIRIIGPVDFVRKSAYRLQEISNADFLMFSIVKDPAKRAEALAQESIDDYFAEEKLFKAWFSSLEGNNGVRTFADNGRLRLLEIVDHAKFENSLQSLMREHRWRAVFVEANPKAWWTEPEILDRPDVAFGRDGPVDFGGKFQVRAVAVATDGDHLTVRFWWRPSTVEPSEKAWYLFVHGVDVTGKILTNSALPMNSIAWSSSAATYRMQVVEVPLLSGSPPSALAVGIYLAEAGRADTLQASRGQRDWGDRRLIIPLRPR